MEDQDREHPDAGPPGAIDFDVIAGLQELGGDDDPGLVIELIEMFLGDAPQRMAEMRQALDSDDIDGVARAAHTLKSSSANMGAMVFSRLCRDIEELARSERKDELAERAQACFIAYEDAEKALQEIRAA